MALLSCCVFFCWLLTSNKAFALLSASCPFSYWWSVIVSPSSFALHSTTIVTKDISFVDLVKYQHLSSTVFTLKHPWCLPANVFSLLSPSLEGEWKGTDVGKMTGLWGWSMLTLVWGDRCCPVGSGQHSSSDLTAQRFKKNAINH